MYNEVLLTINLLLHDSYFLTLWLGIYYSTKVLLLLDKKTKNIDLLDI